jgi:hypothetical protein
MLGCLLAKSVYDPVYLRLWGLVAGDSRLKEGSSRVVKRLLCLLQAGLGIGAD